ncbi:hypothetical protein ZYGM_002849 [Zygosaccharomyces mellis]|uniref:DSC E3 ubiquitin ligase complex subunit 3 C-terminal domain-containing protein n=1 Tax=Zygosaccharomyces mellis TaxID=42258 RepID=A0A4C2EEC7_9SACH|nr:hypothetical protein ZYGM_002849 [Zygosaccharomyces mellis]
MSQEPLLPLYRTPPSSPIHRFIVIRFSDVSIRDLEIDITDVPYRELTTRWLRQKCRERRPQETECRRLKFIRSGALLNSHADLSSELSRHFIRQDAASNSNDGNRDQLRSKFYIHCIVGTERLERDQLINEDAMDDAGPSREGITTQAIGFDRLRAVGFTDEEIELLRQQFRATYGDLETEPDRNGDDNDIRQLEEQWMESGTERPGEAVYEDERFNAMPTANFRHNRDLLVGICVGFFLGLFGLLLMKTEGLFSRRQKMAIVAGVMVNVMFNVVRGF